MKGEAAGGARLKRAVTVDSAKRSVGPLAIITGASSGIGRALALRLGAAGFRVGLIARRRDELTAAAAAITAAGGAAVPAIADVADRGALRAAVAEIEGRLGPADVMVANAGFGVPTQLDPLNTPDVEQTIRVNVLGVIYSIESVLPGMIARRRGHLVAISSLAAFKGLPGESAYCASKSAVNAYMEGLRIALGPKGVVVTTVCPGFVETPMSQMNTAAMPFLMSADAAARRIARLIARRRGGVVRFPLAMALLMSLIARLPDAVVARLVHAEPGPRPGNDAGDEPAAAEGAR